MLTILVELFTGVGFVTAVVAAVACVKVSGVAMAAELW